MALAQAASEPVVPTWLQIAAVVTPILVAIGALGLFTHRKLRSTFTRADAVDEVRQMVDERHHLWDQAVRDIRDIAAALQAARVVAEANERQVSHLVTSVDVLKDQLVDNGNNIRLAVGDVSRRLVDMERRGNRKHADLARDIRALQRSVHGSERRIRGDQRRHRHDRDDDDDGQPGGTDH